MAADARLPPLSWVRVFETAARHGSFVTAGHELSLSPAAVSRTVRELEAFMGVALFERGARGLRLTEVAHRYAQAISPAIGAIARACSELHAGAQRTLRVTAMPALAQRWLVPRLGEFNDRHPDIDVVVSAEAAMVDLTLGQYDVALRYTDRCPPGCELIELFGEELFPVLSPALAQRAQLREPRDLFRLNALYDTFWEADWTLWLASLGLEPPRRWRSLYYSLYTMAVDAALAGQGVLIGHARLIEAELRAGLLVAPFDRRVTQARRYCAVVRAGRAGSGTTRAFIEWLGGLARTFSKA